MNALDNYVTLGRSGLRVSPLCLGTMTFGEDWNREGQTFGVDAAASYELMDIYLGAGGNFLDTANIYTKGHSEVIIGDYLKQKGQSARDRVVLATKWLGNMFPGDPNGGGSHRKALYDAVDHSLRRLKTDYIDLLWMHFFDDHTPIDETMRALDDLVRVGKLRYVGFSDTPAWVCARAQTLAELKDWSPLIGLQIEYSLVERTPEHDLIPMARELGMGVTPWSPLKGGFLSGKYTRDTRPEEGGRIPEDAPVLTDRNFDILDAVRNVAERRDSTPARVALAWTLRMPGVASTIIGARKPHHLEDNIKSLELSLSEADMAELNAASAPTPIFPHSFLSKVSAAIQNGMTVNGRGSDAWQLSPTDENRH